MKYKSILLDVDGTIVPVGPTTTPSEKVTMALKNARTGGVRVSLVSGRSINWLVDIFKILDLSDPCIINGGSQIVNPQTQEVLWERPIEKVALQKILEIVEKNNIPFIINEDGTEYKNPLTRNFEKPLAIQLSYFDSKRQSDECLEILSAIPGISAHKFFSWDKDKNYKMDIYITHEEGTKQHSTEKLANILGIETHEMIGVGDSRNDIPLLNVCGLKIAMGNADDKLKAIAHHIVPTVEEDGVAHVIEKFILI